MRFPLQIIKVSGSSMEPELHEGDFLLIYKTTKIKINDIIVFREQNMTMVKRVIDINENGIYVIGDHVVASTDSRHFGRIMNSKILGRVISHL